MARIWRGEYVSSELEQDTARVYFLSTAKALAPEMTLQLQDGVLPAFRAYRESPCYFGEDVGMVRSVDCPEAHDLLSALEAWAQRFNLGEGNFEPRYEGAKGDPWVLNLALETLWFWTWGRPDLRWANEVSRYEPPLSDDEAAFTFTFSKVWEIDRQPWKDFEQAALKQVKRELAKQRPEVEARARAKEWRSVTEKRAFGRHLCWLVCYQVRGMSQAEIERLEDEHGDFYNVTTIGKALATTATLLGMQLRPPDAGGRPKNP